MNSVSKNIDIVNSNRSGRDIYDDVQDIAIEDITSQLEKMIDSSDTFDGWVLSVKDGTRLIKILNSKKRIIKSSFKFQLKQNFSNFKSVPKTRFDKNLTRDQHSLGLTGVDLAAEYQALELIVVGCEQSYSDFYALACQRLQHCVQRSHISETENPVHIKRLCEAFQYSLDALNLDSKFQIALYLLFSHFVIDNLGLTYEKIDQCLINNNVLPALQLSKDEAEVLDLTSKAEIQIDSSTKQDEQDKPEVNNEITSSIKVKSQEVVIPKEPVVPEEAEVLDLTSKTEIQIDSSTKQDEQDKPEVDNEITSSIKVKSLEVVIPKEPVVPEETEVLDLTSKAEIQIDSSTKQDEQDKTEVDNEITSSIKVKSLEVAKPKEPLVPEKADVIPEPQLLQNIEKEPLPLETIDHAAEIQKGDWVEIMQKNETEMAKLVWKSVDCSLFIFVDNTGNRIRELNGSQLNKEFEDGSMNIVTTSSIASNNASLSIVQPFMGR